MCHSFQGPDRRRDRSHHLRAAAGCSSAAWDALLPLKVLPLPLPGHHLGSLCLARSPGRQPQHPSHPLVQKLQCTPTPSCAPCYLWEEPSQRPLGACGRPRALKKLPPHPHRKAQQRHQQRQRDRVADVNRGEPGNLCVCMWLGRGGCWEMPLRWSQRTHICRANSGSTHWGCCLWGLSDLLPN